MKSRICQKRADFGSSRLVSTCAAFVKLLNDWSAKARGKTPPELEPPWCARNYTPYWTQLLSKAVQRGAAEEILARVTEEGTAREAANSGRA